MIPIVLIDQLLINSNSHEQIMKDIFNYCQRIIEMEITGGMNKQWKHIENIEQWKEWPMRTKDYIENVLRQLRNKKEIDHEEHAHYI